MPSLLILGLLLSAVGVAVWILADTPVVLGLVTTMTGVVLQLRRKKSHDAAPAATPEPAPAPDLAWSDARAWFSDLRAEYAAHECDPMAVLRLPALSDVSVPSTARFVDAFAEAQALDTTDFPGEHHAASYVAAVERAERAWRAARAAAERIRLSNLTPDGRGAVERVVKLLTTVRDSDNDAERHVAYARARSELERLDRAGVIRMPPTARSELETAGRGRPPAWPLAHRQAGPHRGHDLGAGPVSLVRARRPAGMEAPPPAVTPCRGTRRARRRRRSRRPAPATRDGGPGPGRRRRRPSRTPAPSR